MNSKALKTALAKANWKGKKAFGKRHAAKVNRRFGKALISEAR